MILNNIKYPVHRIIFAIHNNTTDFLDKSTWILAMILTALVLFSYLSFTDSFGDSDSKIIDTTQKATPAAATPATPNAPAQSAPAPAVPATK